MSPRSQRRTTSETRKPRVSGDEPRYVSLPGKEGV